MAGFANVCRVSLRTVSRFRFSSPLLKNGLSIHSYGKIFNQAKFSSTAFSQCQLQVTHTDHSTFSADREQGSESNRLIHPEDRTVFVAKLSPKSTEKALKEYFSQFGVVEQVALMPSKSVKNIWPHAFVEFRDVSSVEKVLSKDHTIHMRSVSVERLNIFDRPRSRKICVRNIPSESNETLLKEHFAQFGEVAGVEFVHSKPQVEKERYCFVEFMTLSGVVKALESPKQTIGDSVVVVKKFTARPKRIYIRGKAIIEVVPEGLKVKHLRNYFKKFGKLSFVDFIFHRSHNEHSNRDIAFLGFFDDEAVETIVNGTGCHIIEGKEVLVKRSTSLKGNKDRQVKVFVDKIPGVVTRQDLRLYFEAFGDLINLSMRRWGGNENLQSAMLTFSDTAHVDGIMARDKHAIDGKHIIVRRIGWGLDRQ